MTKYICVFTSSSAFTVFALFYSVLMIRSSVSGLDCFRCSSYNNSDHHCEDPFNNTSTYLNSSCTAPRPGRVGTFPATQCLKIKYWDPNDQVYCLYRTCVVDNGGKSDSMEIGRVNHCGILSWMNEIELNGKTVYGCIVTCKTDGCNGSARLYGGSGSLFSVLVAGLVWFLKCTDITP